MFSKILVLCVFLVAVNASHLLSGVALSHAIPAKTVVATHYAAPVVHHAAPVVKSYAVPVAVVHSAPVAVVHSGGYSKSYDSKYFGASKHYIAHGAPLSYSTHSEVNHAHGEKILSHVAPISVGHGYSASTVVKHAAPVVVGYGLGHRLGGIVYGGHKSIHY